MAACASPESPAPVPLPVLKSSRVITMTIQIKNDAAKGLRGGAFGRLKSLDELGLVLALIVLIVLIGLPNPAFFSIGSIKTILRESAFVGIIALGMVYLVSMLEIDLSVGAIYAVSTTTTALLIRLGLDPFIAAGIGLVVGVALGALNGILAAVLDTPLIILSLGTLSVYFGLNLMISGGRTITGMPRQHLFFRFFGGEILGLPTPIWVLFLCGVILHFVFFHTRFGATVRAVGANRAAAEFIGIKVDVVRIQTTALMGLLCAISGLMTLAFFKAVDTSMGEGKELQVIAAVVIGGTSLSGGTGSILGAFLGVMIITVIDSGVVFFGIDSNYARFVTGCVIVAAIALDRTLKRRKKPAGGR
jgi:ribose transport system permease protein